MTVLSSVSPVTIRINQLTHVSPTQLVEYLERVQRGDDRVMFLLGISQYYLEGGDLVTTRHLIEYTLDRFWQLDAPSEPVIKASAELLLKIDGEGLVEHLHHLCQLHEIDTTYLDRLLSMSHSEYQYKTDLTGEFPYVDSIVAEYRSTIDVVDLLDITDDDTN